MTEREKMVSGEWYDGSGKELCDGRARIKDLCHDYNDTREGEIEKRTSLLKEMFFSHGKNICVVPPVQFDYGFNTSVGDNFFSNFNLVILDSGKVTIGNDVFIGPNVTFATPIHYMDADLRRTRFKADGSPYDVEATKPITVGNDVWIASSVTICGGVTIGDGVVIGAGSVVTKDLPPYTLCVGNPCRVIRKLDKDKEK